MRGRTLSLLEFLTMWEEVAAPSNASCRPVAQHRECRETPPHVERWLTHDPCSVPASIFICGAAVCAHRRRELAQEKAVTAIIAVLTVSIVAGAEGNSCRLQSRATNISNNIFEDRMCFHPFRTARFSQVNGRIRVAGATLVFSQG